MNRATYIEQFAPPDMTRVRIEESIAEHGLPPISVAPEYGRLLTFLVKLRCAKNVLEIGSLAGYSSICLARGLPADGHVDALELNAAFARIAAANARQAGVGHCVTYHVGSAVDTLETFATMSRTFDLFFIDADKPNYPRYLELCIQLATDGALIVADNIFLGDRLLNPDNHDPSTIAMRVFHERILNDAHLETLLFPMHDGLSVTRVTHTEGHQRMG